MKRRESGFTIIEVLIAIILLSLGVLALASSAGAVTRLTYRGKSKTAAAMLSQRILDSLRYEAKASSATPDCSVLVDGASTPRPSWAAAWRVTTPALTDERRIRVIVSYNAGPRTLSDTVYSSFYCP